MQSSIAVEAERAVTERALIGLVLASWEELDLRAGPDMGCFFTDDAVLDLGATAYSGRDEIVAFFTARRERGPRVARHVLTNIRVHHIDEDRGEVHGYMLIYGSDGHAPLPLAPPATLGDIVDTCVRGEGGAWRIASRRFTPLFVSAENPSPFLPSPSS